VAEALYPGICQDNNFVEALLIMLGTRCGTWLRSIPYGRCLASETLRVVRNEGEWRSGHDATGHKRYWLADCVLQFPSAFLQIMALI
jgi:hypothetical protein